MKDESKRNDVFSTQFFLITFLSLSFIILFSGCLNLTGDSNLSNTIIGPMEVELRVGSGPERYFSMPENYDRIAIIIKLIKGKSLWINITNTGDISGAHQLPNNNKSNSNFTSILSSDWLTISQSHNSTHRFFSTKLEIGNYFYSLKNYGNFSIRFCYHVYLEPS